MSDELFKDLEEIGRRNKKNKEVLFELHPLTKLRIKHNKWINTTSQYDIGPSMVLRTKKGTGQVYYSDCMGNYDKNGEYQSIWYHIERSNGDLTMGIEATTWEDAKTCVEKELRVEDQ